MLWGDAQAGGKEGSINAALLCLEPWEMGAGFGGVQDWGNLGSLREL